MLFLQCLLFAAVFYWLAVEIAVYLLMVRLAFGDPGQAGRSWWKRWVDPHDNEARKVKGLPRIKRTLTGEFLGWISDKL